MIGYSVARSRWLPLVPPFVLLLVAANQIYLAAKGTLSPWKGGGFGMFSTNDRGDDRRVRVWVSDPQRTEEIEIPAGLSALTRKSVYFPRSSQLEALGREVAAALGNGEVTQVRIGVWRREFNRESLAMSWVPIEEVVVEVADRTP